MPIQGSSGTITPFTRRAACASGLLAVILVAARPAVGADALPFPTAPLPPEALTALAPPARTAAPANPKLDWALERVAGAAALSAEGALAQARAATIAADAERVQVEIVVEPSRADAVTSAVSGPAIGGEVTGRSRRDGVLQAWVRPDRLAALAARADVRAVRTPARAYPAATTEALDDMSADDWQAAGIDGAGVQVGIIDVGFLDYTGLLGTDLPASVTVQNFVDGQTSAQVDGTSTHGTSMAEIIHDVAPGAALHFAKIATVTDFLEAADWMIDTIGVDVINTSLLFYNQGPGDGTGAMADKVAEARAQGITWVTAAGNDRINHYAALFDDPEADGWHNFGPSGQFVNWFGPGDGTGYLIPPGSVMTVFLRWDDWENVDQDYNLDFVRFYPGQGWGFWGPGSYNDQSGQPGQTPTEFISVAAGGAEATYYGYVVNKDPAATRSVNLDVFAPGPLDTDKRTNARSLVSPGDSPDAITVAAVSVTTPTQQLTYSAEGPTNGPGGVPTGGLLKPDLTGFADVSTESSSPFQFGLTSAATAHVTGAAALVSDFYAILTPLQKRDLLGFLSQDLGSLGPDTKFGAGRVDLRTPGDADGDGIADDGDASGVAGDALCFNGATSGCDDICVAAADATQADQDFDGTGDACDNCTVQVNGGLFGDAGGQSQRDTDADGFGNACDPDFDNDLVVDAADEAVLVGVFFTGDDPNADLDGNGVVNFVDLGRLKSLLGQPPGPGA